MMLQEKSLDILRKKIWKTSLLTMVLPSLTTSDLKSEVFYPHTYPYTVDLEEEEDEITELIHISGRPVSPGLAKAFRRKKCLQHYDTNCLFHSVQNAEQQFKTRYRGKRR